MQYAPGWIGHLALPGIGNGDDGPSPRIDADLRTLSRADPPSRRCRGGREGFKIASVAEIALGTVWHLACQYDAVDSFGLEIVRMDQSARLSADVFDCLHR